MGDEEKRIYDYLHTLLRVDQDTSIDPIGVMDYIDTQLARKCENCRKLCHSTTNIAGNS
jgi:hypothetical protein